MEIAIGAALALAFIAGYAVDGFKSRRGYRWFVGTLAIEALVLGLCWLGIQAQPDFSFIGANAPQWVQSEEGFHVIMLVAAFVGGTAMLMVAATLRGGSDDDAPSPGDKKPPQG
ncbi:MAG: hypothetical protein AB7M05_04400 [Alphaproteobacteria bacterium]